MPGFCVHHLTRGICWKLKIFSATYSNAADKLFQIPEDLPSNWKFTRNFIISILHFAEVATYLITFCLEISHKYDSSFVNTHHEIICKFADHKNALSIENSNLEMLENFLNIRIAWLYYRKMSFYLRMTQKVKNRQIRICSVTLL